MHSRRLGPQPTVQSTEKSSHSQRRATERSYLESVRTESQGGRQPDWTRERPRPARSIHAVAGELELKFELKCVGHFAPVSATRCEWFLVGSASQSITLESDVVRGLRGQDPVGDVGGPERTKWSARLHSTSAQNIWRGSICRPDSKSRRREISKTAQSVAALVRLFCYANALGQRVRSRSATRPRGDLVSSDPELARCLMARSAARFGRIAPARGGSVQRLAAAFGFVALFALGACEGQIIGISGGTASEGQTPDQVLASELCRTPSAGPRAAPSTEQRRVPQHGGRLARWTGPATEALVAAATQTFPSETESLGFRNNADYLGVSTLVAQGYLDAAEQFLEPIASNEDFLGCTPTPGNELECGTTFLQRFGKRAFRRPLSAAELTQYQHFSRRLCRPSISTRRFVPPRSRSCNRRNSSIAWSTGRRPAGAVGKPSAYEMASRLSYLFWQSMPDQTLLDAAEAGQLDTPKQIEAQARRLLADPKASRLLEYFDEWLGTDTLDTAFVRDPTLYPNLDANLVPLLQQETRAFVSDLLARPGGSLNELLTAPYTFANSELASALWPHWCEWQGLHEGRRAWPRRRAHAGHATRAGQADSHVHRATRSEDPVGRVVRESKRAAAQRECELGYGRCDWAHAARAARAAPRESGPVPAVTS